MKGPTEDPGARAARRAFPGTAVAVVLVLAAAMAALRLTEVPDLDAGDQKKTAQYLLYAWETGDWLLPLEQGHILPTKPPLFPWLGLGAASLLGGPGDLALRLPSAVAGAGLAVLTVLLGRMLGGPAAGLAAGIAVVANALFFKLCGFGRPDMVLCFLVTATLWSFTRIRLSVGSDALSRALFWGSLALGVLTKGPVAVAIPAGAILLLLGWRGGLRGLRSLRAGPGAAAAAVVVLAWLVPALARGGAPLWHTLVVDEVLQRAFDPAARGASGHPASSFLAEVAGRFAPWTLLLPAAVAAAWPAVLRARERYAPRGGPALPLAWLASGLLVFLLPSQKRADYGMAFLPAAALLVGLLLPRLPEAGPWTRRLAAAGAGAVALAALAAAAVAFSGAAGEGSPRVPGAVAASLAAHPGAWRAGTAAAFLLAAGATAAAVLRRGIPAAGMLAGVVLLAAGAERFLLGEEERAAAAARRAFLLRTAAEARESGAAIRTYLPREARENFNSTVAFYAGTAAPPLRHPEAVRARAAEGPLRVVTGGRGASQLLVARAARPLPGGEGPGGLRVLEALGP